MGVTKNENMNYLNYSIKLMLLDIRISGLFHKFIKRIELARMTSYFMHKAAFTHKKRKYV